MQSKAPKTTKAPWYQYLIGLFGLVWNGTGAYDFYLIQSNDGQHLQHFTPAQLEFLFGLPAWVVACWGLSVFGGSLGCVLLLLRRIQAVPLLALSWLTMVATVIYNYGISDGMALMGDDFQLGATVIILLASLLLLLYARNLGQQGQLR